MRHASRAIVIKDGLFLVMRRNKFGHEYYALVGGGVDVGETAEQTVLREVAEETSLVVSNPRLVIVEEAGQIYGTQHIYICDYVSGEPALASGSEEAKITALGRNLYQPLWLPITELPNVDLLPVELKTLLLSCLEHGFPDQPIQLTVSG